MLATSGFSAMVVVRAAAVAAALAPAQIALAEFTGLALLAGPFDAGNDRVIGVASSLTVWFCALAVVLGATAGAHTADAHTADAHTADAHTADAHTADAHTADAHTADAGTTRAGRLTAIAVATVSAAVTGYAVARPLADPVIVHDVPWAVLGGALLGAAVAAALLSLPHRAAPLGVAAHAATVWAVALLAVALTRRAWLYPGLVELAGLDWLRGFTAGPFVNDYHLRLLLPFLVVALVLAGVTAWRARSAGASRPVALAGAAGGPVLAASAYHIVPGTLILWNEDAAIYAGLLAVAALLIAALTVAIPRRDL
jgi:hypothetical protein